MEFFFLRRRTRGVTLIYAVVMMTVLLGFAALAVDLARVQMSKTEAQAAADAAALYAAEGVIGGTPATVQARAVAAAADNKVNSLSVVLSPTQDVDFGVWDPASQNFSVLGVGSQSAATAIRVTVHCSQSRGTAIPLAFAGVLGFTSKDITASAIASIGTVTSSAVQAMASPWLAGMPSGSSVPAYGGNPTSSYAPACSPSLVSVSGGTSIRFAQASGSTSYANAGTYGPDGETDWIVSEAGVNGINTTNAPLNSFVGIFLNDNAPNTTAMGSVLDFSTAASRDFTTLSPALKQVFFIGDGLTSTNQLQTFVAPAGATRLYLGCMDEKGWWWDNVGSINFTTVQGNRAVLVK